MTEFPLEQIMEADFWDRVWARSHQQRGSGSHDLEKNIAMWNDRAASFATNVHHRDNTARRQVIFDFLKSCGVQLAGAKVLDIGSGPGNYTIPMARMGAQVVALDPAPSMLDFLRERAAAEGLTGISYVCEPWEELDLDRLGWRGQFDLVFASMSPGIRDAATLQKLIEASRSYCYLSTFAGGKHRNLQEKIKALLFDEAKKDLAYELILPWNLLYSWGYFPDTKFIDAHWVNEESKASMEARLIDVFSRQPGVPAHFRQVINDLLDRETVDGMVRDEVQTIFGLMVWKARR